MKKLIILLILGIILINFISSEEWVANSTITAGLPDIGTFSAPEVFYKDGFLYMLTGGSGGVVYGFVRSGDTWVANTTINASARITQLPSVFYNVTYLYSLGGDGIGRYNGSIYTDGVGWSINSTINNTLTQGLDEDMRPSVFRYGSDLFMLSGSATSGGLITGKVWVAGGWSNNLTINASIGGQASGTSPEVFYKDGFLWAIVGDSSGNFSGFLRSGDTWVANTTINASLSDVGSYSVPSIFNISGTFYMINGEQGGGWNGSVFKDITSPNITLPFYTNGTLKKNTDTITLNVSVTDTYSTLSACNIEINGTNTTLSISSGWCNTTSISLTGLADGNRTINVYANDSANNWGLNNSFVVFIDTTNPAITINNPTGTKTNQNVTFNFTITDGGTGLSVCRYNVTNNAETQTLVANTYINCSDLFDAKTIADGTNHKVNVFANDTTNNINVTQGLFSVSTAGSGGGGGGGSGTGISGLIQAENFSITTTNRQSNLDVILAKDSVKPREKEFLIINKGIEELEIKVECDTTDVNKSSKEIVICDYVTLSQDTFTISSNEENPAKGTFNLLTPESAEIGEVYYFNLLAKTTDKVSKLSVSARVTSLGIIYKWSYLPFQEDKPDPEKMSYPVTGISGITSLILFTISLVAFRKYKMYASGFFISLGLMIILTGILLFTL